MSDMKRIDPAGVAAWFAAHPEIRPIRSAFAIFDGYFAERRSPLRRLAGCCGLTTRVVEVSGGEELLPELTLGSSKTCLDQIGSIAAITGLHLDYIRGFLCGWDGSSPPAVVGHAAGEMGHADGKAAYAATMEATR